MDQLHRITDTLSKACRYGGDTTRFYSVAEHTAHMVRQAERRKESARTLLCLWLHDVPEWVTGDLLPIVKREPAIAAAFKPIERIAMANACADLNIPMCIGEIALNAAVVKQYDQDILAAEAVTVANPQPGWQPFDIDNKSHVAFRTRLQRSGHMGDNFKYWARMMRLQYVHIMKEFQS